MEVLDKNNYGLSYWAFPDQGNSYLKITDESGKNIKVFNKDFGRGVKYSFYLGSYTLVQEPDLDNIIIVFPNPASKDLYIFSDNFENILLIQIFDLEGNQLLSKSLDNTINTKLSVPIQSLKRGTYFAKIISTEKVITRKFIVE